MSGIIETDQVDFRNNSYKTALKRGDHLLNQIQKLSRAIDVWKQNKIYLKYFFYKFIIIIILIY